jgi:catechol 2,3-dioxygenase-like lactoylglutathione lyase family enzyme
MSPVYPRSMSHIGVSVTDLEKAVEFYTKVLG